MQFVTIIINNLEPRCCVIFAAYGKLFDRRKTFTSINKFWQKKTDISNPEKLTVYDENNIGGKNKILTILAQIASRKIQVRSE